MWSKNPMRRRRWQRILLLAGLAAAGCEESQETLNVEPSSVTLSPSTNSVIFQVTGEATNATFATPITWTVSNPGLGTIANSSAFSALYVGGDGTGDNIVTARDNLGNEGFATVRRTGEAGTLTLTANPVSISADSDTSVITAVGGTAPFEWWTLDTALGRIISAADSDTAVYRSMQPGVNVVHARDVYGLTGTVAITQLDAVAEPADETPAVAEETGEGSPAPTDGSVDGA